MKYEGIIRTLILALAIVLSAYIVSHGTAGKYTATPYVYRNEQGGEDVGVVYFDTTTGERIYKTR